MDKIYMLKHLNKSKILNNSLMEHHYFFSLFCNFYNMGKEANPVVAVEFLFLPCTKRTCWIYGIVFTEVLILTVT